MKQENNISYIMPYEFHSLIATWGKVNLSIFLSLNLHEMKRF